MQHSNIVEVDRGWTQRMTVLGRGSAGDGADDMMTQSGMIYLGSTGEQCESINQKEYQ
jgi:hypothetical protein